MRSPAQVVRCRRLDLPLEAALPAYPPGGAGAEPSRAGTGANEPAGLQHRAEEGTRLRAEYQAAIGVPAVRGESERQPATANRMLSALRGGHAGGPPGTLKRAVTARLSVAK